MLYFIIYIKLRLIYLVNHNYRFVDESIFLTSFKIPKYILLVNLSTFICELLNTTFITSWTNA